MQNIFVRFFNIVMQVLEWPMGRALDPDEVVEIQLQMYNKYFSNKVAASYGLVLQRLVAEGHVAITDHMTDSNNKVIKVSSSVRVKTKCHTR